MVISEVSPYTDAAETAIRRRPELATMEKSSQFLLLTIAIDVVFLIVLGQLRLPGDPTIYAAVALFIVSPLLTYLFVYRNDYRRPFRRSGEHDEVER